MADPLTNEDNGLWYGYDVNAEKTPGSYGVNAAPREANNTLGKDDFLKLLLTQLQYQDPLNPMDNSQMLAQTAQFSALEQMQNMSKSLSHSQAYSMIGKAIYAETFNKETNMYEEVTGTVKAVKVANGEAFLLVDDKEVAVNKVQYVFSDYLAEAVSSLSSNTVTSQALGLIGKFVQAIILDDKKQPKTFVEGQVEHVKFDSKGNPVLVIGNEEVYAGEVISVADEKRLLGKPITAYVAGPENTTQKVVGNVDGVNFKDGKTYLNINGTDVYVKSVALVTDALKYIGQNVDYETIVGKVTGVAIRSGVPYLLGGGTEEVAPKEINFANFKNVKLDAE